MVDFLQKNPPVNQYSLVFFLVPLVLVLSIYSLVLVLITKMCIEQKKISFSFSNIPKDRA